MSVGLVVGSNQGYLSKSNNILVGQILFSGWNGSLATKPKNGIANIVSLAFSFSLTNIFPWAIAI